MEVVNQVRKTNDYSLFKPLVGNRVVNKLHVKRLKDSFEKTYLLNPIIVNDKYEIIDGQHRFQSARELGKPVNFIVAPGYGLREVQVLNENMKNWRKEDYLNAYCDLGHPEYLKFREFMNQFPDFGIAICESFLKDSAATGGRRSANSKEAISETNKHGRYIIKDFQEGNFKIRNYSLAVENAEKIMIIKQYYDGYNRATFVQAMIGIFKNENYNHAQFLSKLSNQPNALQHCANVTQYKLLIEEIFNYRSREKVSLRY